MACKIVKLPKPAKIDFRLILLCPYIRALIAASFITFASQMVNKVLEQGSITECTLKNCLTFDARHRTQDSTQKEDKYTMKYSQQIGAILCLIVIGSCFIPWSYIPSLHATLTGMYTATTDFGKPGILHIAFSFMAFVLFLIPKLWSKRTNIFICAFNLAWAVKNYMLYSMCSAGDCQEKKTGIYIMLIASILMMIMSVLPKIEVNWEQSSKK